MLHRFSKIEQRISKIELPTIFPLDWPCFPTRPNLVSHSTCVCVFFTNNAPSTGHARQCVSEHRWLQHGAPPFVSIRACFGPLWFPFGAASAPIGFHLGSASVRLGSVSVRCPLVGHFSFAPALFSIGSHPWRDPARLHFSFNSCNACYSMKHFVCFGYDFMRFRCH